MKYLRNDYGAYLKETKKIINWHALYGILMELESDGKIERLKAKAGFFWKKK